MTVNFQSKSPNKQVSAKRVNTTVPDTWNLERAQSVASRRGPVDRTVIETESANILKELRNHTSHTPYKSNNKTLQQRIELSIIRNRTPSRAASGVASLLQFKAPAATKSRTLIDSNDTLSEGAINNTKYYARFAEEYGVKPANQIEINFTKMLHGGSVHEDQQFGSVPSHINDSVTDMHFIDKRSSKITSGNFASVNFPQNSITQHLETSSAGDQTPLQNLDTKFKQESPSLLPEGRDVSAPQLKSPLEQNTSQEGENMLTFAQSAAHLSSAELPSQSGGIKESAKSLFLKEKQNTEIRLSPGGSRITVLQKKKQKSQGPSSPKIATPKGNLTRLIPPPGGVLMRPSSGKARLISTKPPKTGSPLQPKHLLELRRLQPVLPPPPKLQTPARGGVTKMHDVEVQLSNKQVIPSLREEQPAPEVSKKKRKKKKKLLRPSSSPDQLYHSPRTGRMQAYLRIPTPSTMGGHYQLHTEEDESPDKIHAIYSNIYEQGATNRNEEPTTVRSMELHSNMNNGDEMQPHNESIVLTEFTGYDMLDESKYSKLNEEKKSKAIRVEDKITPFKVPSALQDSVHSMLHSENEALRQVVTLHEGSLQDMKLMEDMDMAEFGNSHFSKDSAHSKLKSKKIKVKTPSSIRKKNLAQGSSPVTLRKSYSPRQIDSTHPDLSKQDSSISSTLLIKGIQPRYLKYRSVLARQSGTASVEPAIYDHDHQHSLNFEEAAIFTRRASVQSSRLPSRKQSLPSSLQIQGHHYIRESINQKLATLRSTSSPERALEEEAISACKILLRETNPNLNYTSIHEYESRDGHSSTEQTGRFLAEPIRVEFRPSSTFKLSNTPTMPPSGAQSERPILTIRRLSPRKIQERTAQSQRTGVFGSQKAQIMTESDQIGTGLMKEVYSKTYQPSPQDAFSRQSSMKSPHMAKTHQVGSFSAISGGPRFSGIGGGLMMAPPTLKQSKSSSRTASFHNPPYQEIMQPASTPGLHMNSTEQISEMTNLRLQVKHKRPATVCKGFIQRVNMTPLPSILNQSRLSLPDELYFKKTDLTQARMTLLSGRPQTGVEDLEPRGSIDEPGFNFAKYQKQSISQELQKFIKQTDYRNDLQRAKGPTLWTMMTSPIVQKDVSVGRSPKAAKSKTRVGSSKTDRERPIVTNVKRIKVSESMKVERMCIQGQLL